MLPAGGPFTDSVGDFERRASCFPRHLRAGSTSPKTAEKAPTILVVVARSPSPEETLADQNGADHGS
jgi:hypothetical protein